MANDKNLWERLLSAGERRYLKSITKRADAIVEFEPQYEAMSADELRGSTERFRERYEAGETLDDLLPEVFAAVRESSKRGPKGERHYDVQMIGGIALHEGNIAEMLTGEGKTLVATLALVLNAIPGHNVHLVTTNDYLAQRDAEWNAPIYEAIGMTVGSLYNMQPRDEKKAAYECDITYGTNSEFGFDFLRDNMAFSLDDIVQRGHHFAIVDEVDSILIDEARTPLIISGQPEESSETYYQFAKVARKMKAGEHYEVDEKMHTAFPTEAGVALAESELNIENLYLAEHNQKINHLIQSIRAQGLYKKDKEYIVADGEVKIVDEHTGRVMEGRRWSEGLHQAVEAKEGVAIKEENTTVASVTIQNYFRLYDKLAGMTGTAYTEAPEFSSIYDLDVVQIPPNRPVQRLDKHDLLFLSERAKYKAIVNDVRERNEIGQPVLIGTIAVEKSELLSNWLAREGIEHHVLNAKHHDQEAEVIKNAGKSGAVTIATNMAGRGVDIKISDEVRNVGGLYVLGTERHDSRRIDNQLRGRSGRQGDPGESRFYISTEDDLARVFGGDRMQRILTSRLAEWPEDEPLEMKMLTRGVEKAQKRVEEVNALRRKNVLKYDDVMNTQRNVIYGQRREVLEGHDMSNYVDGWFSDEVHSIVMSHTTEPYPEEWDFEGMFRHLNALAPESGISQDDFDEATLEREDIVKAFTDVVEGRYAGRVEEYGRETMSQVERLLFLQVLDKRWREHLDHMDYLRDGIGLRGFAQKQPLAEYQREGFEMFSEMEGSIKGEIVNLLLHVELQRTDGDEGAVEEPDAPDADLGDEEGSIGYGQSGESTSSTATGGAVSLGGWTAGSEPGNLQYQAGGAPSALEEARGELDEGPAIQQRTVEEKVGRNEQCPCGSGKKYKNCHGK